MVFTWDSAETYINLYDFDIYIWLYQCASVLIWIEYENQLQLQNKKNIQLLEEKKVLILEYLAFLR